MSERVTSAPARVVRALRSRRPRVPLVLLEQTFVNALADADHARHGEAAGRYDQLLRRYEAGEIRLMITRETARGAGEKRRRLLAPAEVLDVAGQYRHAGSRMTVTDDPRFAALLVTIRRERVSAVATFDRRFDAFARDVELVPPVPQSSPA